MLRALHTTLPASKSAAGRGAAGWESSEPALYLHPLFCSPTATARAARTPEHSPARGGNDLFQQQKVSKRPFHLIMKSTVLCHTCESQIDRQHPPRTASARVGFGCRCWTQPWARTGFFARVFLSFPSQFLYSNQGVCPRWAPPLWPSPSPAQRKAAPAPHKSRRGTGTN